MSPARSKRQQMLAAIALHHPGKVRDKSILSMSKDELRKMAETKRAGLPEVLAARQMKKKRKK